MEKVFLTGADGMLGNSILRELLKRHYQVKCLVQKGRKNETLKHLDIEIVEGDLLDSQSWKHHVADCCVLINAAAYTQVYPRKNNLCFKINFEAVQNLISICKEYSLMKFIQIGTATSFTEGPLNNLGNEDSRFTGAKYNMDYITSKYKAQVLLLNEHKLNNFPVVIINPTYMIGPYDSLPSSGKMIVAITNKTIPGYSNGGKSFVYSLDVAVAVVNSMKLGKIGECYIAGGENLSYGEFFKKVCNVNKVKKVYTKIPSLIILTYGFTSSVLARITAKAPTLSYGMAKISLINQYYASDKAIQELKMPQTKIEIAIEECTKWLKKNNTL